MKKILALVLAVTAIIGCISLSACSSSNKENTTTVAQTDSDYIKSNGKLVVGITEYEPMDYKENDEWTGFDVEFGKAVAEKLGVDIEFVEIDWDNKWSELDSKKIDCVWNGMTITEEAKKNSSVSNAYVINAQVVVMKSTEVSKYKDAASMKSLKFAAESGSAGMDAAEEAGLTATEYGTQSDALMAVESGKADACVIDITMAKAMTGENTSYKDLSVGISLTEEEYGVSFRKGSDMIELFNGWLAELKADGTLAKLAEKYSLTLA